MLEALSLYTPLKGGKKYDFCDKSIKNDIEMLKYLYNLDLTNIYVNTSSKGPAILWKIFDKAKNLCDATLFKQTEQFTDDPLIHKYFYEASLSHLVLETFLSITKKKYNGSASLTKYTKNYAPDKFEYKHFAKMYRTYFQDLPFNKFINAVTKTNKERTSYKISTYLSPVFSRVINSSEKCPYYILSQIGIDSVGIYDKSALVRYFEKYIYGKYIGKKPLEQAKLKQKATKEGEFSKKEYEELEFKNQLLTQRSIKAEKDPFTFYKYSHTLLTNQTNGDNLYWEVLSYFVLDGFYSLNDIVHISKECLAFESDFSSEYVAKSLSTLILIPNNFIKSHYIQTIFNILNSHGEVKNFDCKYLYFTDKGFHKMHEIQKSNLLFCRKYVNYLATVYYPLLIKCFEIIYYNSTVGDVTLLKKYIKKHKLLDYYKNKTSSSIQALKALKHPEYIQVLKMYKYIEEYIFNNETTPKLKYLLSANYSSFAPYMSDILSNITANKTHVDENSFYLPI